VVSHVGIDKLSCPKKCVLARRPFNYPCISIDRTECFHCINLWMPNQSYRPLTLDVERAVLMRKTERVRTEESHPSCRSRLSGCLEASQAGYCIFFPSVPAASADAQPSAMHFRAIGCLPLDKEFMSIDLLRELVG
jgi:hypothetical protein